MKEPSWGSSPSRTACGCSGSSTRTSSGSTSAVSLLVLVLPAYFDLSLKDALAGDARRRADRQRDARGGRPDRGRRARAVDGPPARAARPARLLHRDRAQRGQCLGLGDLRADRDRDRGGPALRQALRVRGDVGSGSSSSAAPRAAARPDGADRLRPPLRPQVRDLGCRRVGRLPRPGGSSTAPTSARSGRRRGEHTARSGSPSTR